MGKPETFAIIGGDLRYVYLAGALAEDGYKVIAVGFDNTDLPPCVAGCTDAAQAITLSDAVILPMPVTTDGKLVNAPFSRLCLPLEQVYAAVKPTQLVFGGGMTQDVKDAFLRREITAQDYLKREELAVRNAVPTAEGAIQLALEELPVTIDGSSCLITGYGRIGKVLTQAASVLKIKPIIHLYEGELQAAGIVRARKKSIRKFMDDAKAFFADKDINDYRICTGKGHDKEEYDAFHREVAEEMKALGFTGEVESYQIGCTIGVHTGPTPIGIACIRKFDA